MRRGRAVRELAEVKRMYTRAAARGRGVAKALLTKIEDEARAAGVPVLRLETGIRQPEAIGLYERMGFRSCSAFGPYATMPATSIDTSLFYEKPVRRGVRDLGVLARGIGAAQGVRSHAANHPARAAW